MKERFLAAKEAIDGNAVCEVIEILHRKELPCKAMVLKGENVSPIKFPGMVLASVWDSLLNDKFKVKFVTSINDIYMIIMMKTNETE